MKKYILSILFSVLFCSTISAQVVPIPITAEQAFDAVQTQTDPITGMETTVVLVDVRTRAEFFWVGAASQVDEIKTAKGKTYIPDYGKVLLVDEGKFLVFNVNGLNKRIQVKEVSMVNLSPVAINIPFLLWDEENCTLFSSCLSQLLKQDSVLVQAQEIQHGSL